MPVYPAEIWCNNRITVGGGRRAGRQAYIVYLLVCEPKNPQLQYIYSCMRHHITDTRIFQSYKVCCRCYCGCCYHLLLCQSCTRYPYSATSPLHHLYDLCIIQSATEMSFAVVDRRCGVCASEPEIPKQFPPLRHTVSPSIQHSQLSH